MIIDNQSKIGEIVAKNFRAAGVFENFGLDFCCDGKKTISEACSQKGINEDEVIFKLTEIDNVNDNSMHFDDWDPDFLINYIVNNHHSYVTRTIPTIEHHLQKVTSKHGEKHPETIKIFDIFANLKEELLNHMQKEEKMLFPYINKMVVVLKNDLEMPHPPFGSVINPVKVMESEHEAAGNFMAEIRKLSNNYIPPKNACATFKVLYAELQEFETDLHTHVHLENNILFPKASKLEKKLLEKSHA